MKRRSLTLVLCLLATLSLASVGFAAWVISAGDIENATGQISVDTVTDDRIMISEIKIGESTWNGTGWTETAPQFIFGKPAGGVNFWLKNDDLDEVLELTLSFKVVKVAKDDQGNEVVVDDAQTSVVLAAAQDTDFGNWIEVVTPKANTEDEVTNKGNGYYECTLELRWGSAWNYMNPYDYFAGKEIDGEIYYNATTYACQDTEDEGFVESTWGEVAVKKLQAMEVALRSAQFQITIDAQPAQN